MEVVVKKEYNSLDDIVEDKGMKYVKVAEKIGVTYNNFWFMRNDVQRISFKQMKRLAEVLDVEVDVIFDVIRKTELKQQEKSE